jgi:serine protease Do
VWRGASARRAGVALAMVVAVAASCRRQAPGGDHAGDAGPAPVPSSSDARRRSDVHFVYPAAPGSFVALAKEVERGVVALRSTRKVVGGPSAEFTGADDDYALGSGFLIDTSGYLLTADSVIANASEVIAVLYDSSERPAIVAGRDPKLDVALLKIDLSPRLEPLPLGDSDRTEVGEWVIAVGNAFGLGARVSAGIIARKGASPPGPAQQQHRTFLITDAAIDAGNAGGPLINTAGEVVGIAVRTAGRGVQVGYAVPINQARQILPMLKADGRVTRAWLGIYVHPVTVELARHLRLPEPVGAFVSDVIANGPAARAGIRRKDVVLRFDGRDVDHKSLPWVASTAGVPREVEVIVWRDGAELPVRFVTEAMPE